MMNKYQEAFANVKRACIVPFLGRKPIDICGVSLDRLKELVERATPKKPIKRYYTEKYGNNGRIKRVDIRCPHCNSYLTNGTRTSLGVYASREKAFIETVSDRKYCSACSQAIDWSEEE